MPESPEENEKDVVIPEINCQYVRVDAEQYRNIVELNERLRAANQELSNLAVSRHDDLIEVAHAFAEQQKEIKRLRELVRELVGDEEW